MDPMRLALSSIRATGATRPRLPSLLLVPLIVVALSACATPIEPRIVEVTRQVPIEVTGSVSERVEVVREVPVEVTRAVPRDAVREAPIEVTRVVPREVVREVVKEVAVEVTREVVREVVKEIVVTATPRARATGRPAATQAPPSDTLVILVPDLGFEDPVPWRSGSGTGILRLIYDPLLGVDTQGRLSDSGLAQSWELSGDGTEWVFNLSQQGISFHHGKQVGPEDMIFAVQKWLEERPVSRIRDNLETLEPIDDYTMLVRTHSPDFSLIWDFTDTRLPLTFAVPKEHYEQVGDEEFARGPIGTGPYRHVEHRRHERLVVEAQERHWREGVPAMQHVRFLVLQDEPRKIAALKTGQVDLISLSHESVLPIKNGGFRVFVRERWTTVGFRFHQQWDDVPIADVRVRRALNYAVDRHALANIVFHGLAWPAAVPARTTGPLARISPEPYPFDPERARELLAEAGYPDGFSGLAIHAYHRQPAPYGVGLAEALAESFGQIGVYVDVSVSEYSVFRPSLLNQAIPGDMSYWHSDASPAPYFVRSMEFVLHSTNPFTTTKDPELDRIIETLSMEFDPAEGLELMSYFLETTHDHANYLPLLHVDIPYAASGKVPTDWELGKRSWHPDYLDVVRRR